VSHPSLNMATNPLISATLVLLRHPFAGSTKTRKSAASSYSTMASGALSSPSTRSTKCMNCEGRGFATSKTSSRSAPKRSRSLRIDRVRSPFGSGLYIFRDTKVARYSGIVDSIIYRKALAGESQEAVNTLTERLSTVFTYYGIVRPANRGHLGRG